LGPAAAPAGSGASAAPGAKPAAPDASSAKPDASSAQSDAPDASGAKTSAPEAAGAKPHAPEAPGAKPHAPEGSSAKASGQEAPGAKPHAPEAKPPSPETPDALRTPFDAEMDRSTKPHMPVAAPYPADVPEASAAEPAVPTKPAGVDDRPTSPAAIDAAPPTEDSLPRILETPPARPALKIGPAMARVQRAWDAAKENARAAYRRTSAWAAERRPAIEAAVEARRQWFLPLVAVAGLAIGIGIVALGISFVTWLWSPGHRGADGEAAAKTAANASASPSPEPAAPSANAAAPPAAAPPAACTVAGGPRSLAPKALVPAGVEVRALGDSLAIGFAASEHQGVALRVDPATLAAGTTTTTRSKSAVRRVTPAASTKDALGAILDTDRHGDALSGRRTVALDPAVQLGTADGALQWAKPNGGPAGKLWALDGDGDADAIRAATDDAPGERTLGIVFRRSNAVNVGLASGGDTLAPKGPLASFAGSGSAIGSPTIAVQDGVAIVAWADRASQDDPWKVRWVRFKEGDAPGQPAMFTPPGAREEQTMSPALVAVPGKRFLLVWTEGPQSRHGVRALTLSEDGTPIGEPLVVSADGVNAGQGQAAVTASGHGVIAFLESTDDGFGVTATPVHCGP
jgi:hypothetical protein